MSIIGKVSVGQYDADELAEMERSEEVQKMITQDRIFLDGDYDKGQIWVEEGDGEAFKLACEYAF